MKSTLNFLSFFVVYTIIMALPVQAGILTGNINFEASKNSEKCLELQYLGGADKTAQCLSDHHILDNENIRERFLELWEASGTDQSINQRKEQGGWIVETEDNGYEVISFPSSWDTSACHIDLPGNFLEMTPQNLVGVVHTHPFYEGEDTTSSDVCGAEAEESYESGGNYKDLELIVRIADHISDYCIKGFIIDGSNIISMNTFGQMVFYPVGSYFQRATS